MKKSHSKLTPQQWRLYEYLKHLMLCENNRTTTIKEIVEAFPFNELANPDGYLLNETEGNHSNCPRLYEDLKAITFSNEVDMIVCTNSNKIRLGTELDVLKRLTSLIDRTRWEEEEIRVIKAKIKNNRQMKLLSNAGIPLDLASPDTKAWHQAFSDDNIALTIKQLQQEEKANDSNNRQAS